MHSFFGLIRNRLSGWEKRAERRRDVCFADRRWDSALVANKCKSRHLRPVGWRCDETPETWDGCGVRGYDTRCVCGLSDIGDIFVKLCSGRRARAKTCKQVIRESIMAARCAVCGKGPQTGYTVSHSHIRNKRTFRPNLQPVRTTVDGENVRVRVCAKCLKAGKVARVAA